MSIYREVTHSPPTNTVLLSSNPLTGVPGTVFRIDEKRPICLLVCSVKSGAVDVWLSNMGGGNLPLVPDLYFGQTNTPTVVLLPTGVYGITCRLDGAISPVIASIILGGPQ